MDIEKTLKSIAKVFYSPIQLYKDVKEIHRLVLRQEQRATKKKLSK